MSCIGAQSTPSTQAAALVCAEDWASLSPHGQAITRYIRADAGARVAGVGLLAVGDRVSNGMSRAEFAAARL